MAIGHEPQKTSNVHSAILVPPSQSGLTWEQPELSHPLAFRFGSEDAEYEKKGKHKDPRSQPRNPSRPCCFECLVTSVAHPGKTAHIFPDVGCFASLSDATFAPMSGQSSHHATRHRCSTRWMYVCLISASVCDKDGREGVMSGVPTRSRTLLFGFIACLYEFVAHDMI